MPGSQEALGSIPASPLKHTEESQAAQICKEAPIVGTDVSEPRGCSHGLAPSLRGGGRLHSAVAGALSGCREA